MLLYKPSKHYRGNLSRFMLPCKIENNHPQIKDILREVSLDTP